MHPTDLSQYRRYCRLERPKGKRWEIAAPQRLTDCVFACETPRPDLRPVNWSLRLGIGITIHPNNRGKSRGKSDVVAVLCQYFPDLFGRGGKSAEIGF